MADVLPHPLANKVVDTMRAYMATTLGVLANVGGGGGHSILGFIAYGYRRNADPPRSHRGIPAFAATAIATTTIRPGSWTAGEVAGLGPSKPIFCIPAQQTIPVCGPLDARHRRPR